MPLDGTALGPPASPNDHARWVSHLRTVAWVTSASLAAMVIVPAIVIWTVARDEGPGAVIGSLIAMALPQVVVAIALARYLRRSSRRAEAARAELAAALDEVHRLSGLLPIWQLPRLMGVATLAEFRLPRDCSGRLTTLD